MQNTEQRFIFHVDVNSAFLSWTAVDRLRKDPGSVDLRTIPAAICADPAFGVTRGDLEDVLEPSHYIGRSAEQVEEFLNQVIRPMLQENAQLLGAKAELHV